MIGNEKGGLNHSTSATESRLEVHATLQASLYERSRAGADMAALGTRSQKSILQLCVHARRNSAVHTSVPKGDQRQGHHPDQQNP